MTGMAVTVGKDGSQCLHYTPFMPSSSMPAQSLLRSPYGAINLTQSTWATSMQDLRRSFSEDYKLFDHVATRCWGMTAAPNRRHVATCLTLHPSDMVQYATNVQQDVYLAITDEMDHVVPTAGQGKHIINCLHTYNEARLITSRRHFGDEHVRLVHLAVVTRAISRRTKY